MRQFPSEERIQRLVEERPAAIATRAGVIASAAQATPTAARTETPTSGAGRRLPPSQRGEHRQGRAAEGDLRSSVVVRASPVPVHSTRDRPGQAEPSRAANSARSRNPGAKIEDLPPGSAQLFRQGARSGPVPAQASRCRASERPQHEHLISLLDHKQGANVSPAAVQWTLIERFDRDIPVFVAPVRTCV